MRIQECPHAEALQQFRHLVYAHVADKPLRLTFAHLRRRDVPFLSLFPSCGNLSIGTIWETLTADPSFSMLAKALNTTALARSLDTLKGASYTLFAPDDAAIEASQNFPEGEVTIMPVE